ncbi:adenylate/guanylate cyclase domain-containing protein [Rhodovulum sp. DZ06]|uniref:adenylate/guanylate cyclase domain-containing protein n=1 Tax=Rhodovulum sp. DZ06 TaxID=3425126 RepID=UPI003D34ACF4
MTHATLTSEIEIWLLEEAVRDPDIQKLFSTLCARLHGIGVPVERAALTWPTLHPLFEAEQIYWRLGEESQLRQYPHETARNAAWEQSPFRHIIVNRLPRLRRRLTGDERMVDFPVLVDLEADGFTDYLLVAEGLSIGDVRSYDGADMGVMASWATRREGGFSASDIEALTRIQRVFSVAVHSSIQSRIQRNLASVYLGETAAQRVLSGTIQRGDGEVIRAVVWYSDLRGSTRLSNTMDAKDYLKLLRCYYDCTAQPVIDEGGEILEFIGDAVLAIFPIRGDTGGPEAIRAAVRAMRKSLQMREAKLAEHEALGLPEELRFSVSMTVGEMMFGNIGVPDRLTFSAIGRAVNKVARIDEMSKRLGRMVLVTREIAQVEPERWISAGVQQLRDFDEPVELMTCACGTDMHEPVAAAG